MNTPKRKMGSLGKVIIGITTFFVTIGAVSALTTPNSAANTQPATNVVKAAPQEAKQNVLPAQEVKPEPAQTAAPTPTPAPAPQPVTCDSDHYINAAGNCVQRPTQAPSTPAGATAQCRDGSYSFSQSRRGTCSHHGGVATWL